MIDSRFHLMAHLTMVRTHKCTRTAISFTRTTFIISTGIQWSVGGDGDGRTYGRVEVSYDGVRGTICDLGWGTADARVLCRQLGKETLNNQGCSLAKMLMFLTILLFFNFHAPGFLNF